ncbi:hypothetical protein N9N67_02050 [Bacteriovoracaceae bacterium]|nr:hypothetical protein [Bacteriovoracaceae bacterium]
MILRLIISCLFSFSIIAHDGTLFIEGYNEFNYEAYDDPDKGMESFQIDQNENNKISFKEARHYLNELPSNSTCAHDYQSYRQKLLRKLSFKPLSFVGATAVAVAAGASIGAAAGGLWGYSTVSASGAFGGISQIYSAVSFGAQGAIYVSTAVGATIIVGYLVGTGIQIAKLRRTSKMLKLMMEAEVGTGIRLQKFVDKLNRKRDKRNLDPFTVEEVAEKISELNQTKEMCRPEFIQQFSKRKARKLAKKNDLKYKVISQNKFRRYFQNMGMEENEL